MWNHSGTCRKSTVVSPCKKSSLLAPTSQHDHDQTLARMAPTLTSQMEVAQIPNAQDCARTRRNLKSRNWKETLTDSVDWSFGAMQQSLLMMHPVLKKEDQVAQNFAQEEENQSFHHQALRGMSPFLWPHKLTMPVPNTSNSCNMTRRVPSSKSTLTKERGRVDSKESLVDPQSLLFAIYPRVSLFHFFCTWTCTMPPCLEHISKYARYFLQNTAFTVCILMVLTILEKTLVQHCATRQKNKTFALIRDFHDFTKHLPTLPTLQSWEKSSCRCPSCQTGTEESLVAWRIAPKTRSQTERQGVKLFEMGWQCTGKALALQGPYL